MEAQGKKYSFTSNILEYEGKVLHQIVACKEFTVAGTTVKEGQLGGYLEGEHNLSQEGNCWVFRHCIVCDNAHVKDNAIVRYGSLVENCALIFGDAIITESGIHGHGKVGDRARVSSASVYDDAEVLESASLTGEGIFHPLEQKTPQPGDTYIAEFARMKGYAQVYNGPAISGYALVGGHSKVNGTTKIHGEAVIDGDAKIWGNAEVRGHAHVSFFEDVCGDAVLE